MSTTRPDRSVSQQGFTTLAALFILIVLAGLGGYVATLTSSQSLTQALDIMSSRAASAAKAGADWGVNRVSTTPNPQFRTDCEAAGATYAGATPATATLAAGTFAGDLASLRVEIECRSQSYDEAGTTYRVYQIVATACNAAACPAAAPGLGYVEHRQVARVRQ